MPTADDIPIQVDEDVRLMLKVKTGDRQAYAWLYEKYVPIVRRYLVGRGAQFQSWEDLAQEAFTRLWEHRRRYRAGTPTWAYLLGFVRNVAREHEARMRRAPRREPYESDRVAEVVNRRPEATAYEQELVERVRFHFARLPPKQRRAMELVYLAHTSIAEAAEIMGCSRAALRRSLHEARRRLQKTLLGDTGKPAPY